MSFEAWDPKAPGEVLDYQFNWVPKLAGDSIVSSVVSVQLGDVVIDEDSSTPEDVTVWLSGGTLGTTCNVRNHITTAGGRQMEKTAALKIKAK